MSEQTSMECNVSLGLVIKILKQKRDTRGLRKTEKENVESNERLQQGMKLF